jgi:uncharacterized protein YabE (DUF348 family)
MDGNSTERGRHRHRAHTDHSPAVGNPQWRVPSSDRPEWTTPEPEPRSWFDQRDPDRTPPAQDPAEGADRWRPVSDLTDTAWGTDGAWHDPAAPWNVAAPARPGDAPDRRPGDAVPDSRGGFRDTPAPTADYLAGVPDRAGWDRETGWGTDAAWATEAGWNSAGAPTDSAWAAAAAEPAAPVAVLDRPAEPVPETPERRHAVRHPLRIGLFALVLFGLVAGSVAWLSMDKSVTLTVDGEARAVKTYASTVGGVLDDEKITVGAHDTLAPSRDAKITDGAEIVLRRGRLVTLTVDGKPRQVWTTATTVQEALEQIGYRQDGLWLSTNRSTRLPLDGYQLTLRTPKTVTVVADGKRHTVTTAAATVGEAMELAGVRIDADDKVSQLAGAPVRAGMVITVTRVLSRTSTTQAVLEYKTVEKSDPDADPGSRTVQTKGVDGLEQVTRVETYVNGTLTGSKITKRTVLKEPVDEVVVVGPEPADPTPPPTAPSQPAECADFPTTGGLNWCGLAKCESGLNPNAYNPAGPYYGLYQFDQQTWTANGGSGSPSGKSIAEQTAVAWTLYQARGAAPWPVCGKNL